MAKLYFRYGAMGSSKTANAIMVQYNYHERGQNALMVKPRLDNRDGERIVGSRSGLSAPCIYMGSWKLWISPPTTASSWTRPSS